MIVGIENGGARRIDELSPWPIDTGGGGEADAFLDWVVGTVIPLAQSELGLRAGPLHAVIGGSSMGGLAALLAHYRYPEIFGGALCMSPSFFAGQGAALPRDCRASASAGEPRVPRLRRLEGGGTMLGLAERMVHTLAAKGYPPEQLRWRPDRRGVHNERSWRRRLPGALRFMFRRGP